MEGILIPFFFFAALFGILYVYYTTRNRERLALIEKGIDAKIFKSGSQTFGRTILSFSLLAIGIGVGVLMGYLFEAMGVVEEVAYTSCIFIFGGIGFLLSFFAAKKLVPEKD
ncbi:DUF6249 domain-containing protein [Algoriphagus sediminis]|uniref:DUF6249 domain-containing protein n=1 Tax=Algoriphagus sediminis TaxID=3057113 RepID=A0ABT7YGW7_9BACT|nr:DUF6249 domain-containing protein [Algoriphagus sediminis]MDN3205763.1 hypothetical protein [Algoriphagus sediminis]